MFELYVVQSLFGDCLLLTYGTRAKPFHMLIDGGPATVYAEYLRPQLAQIAAKGGRLDHVVLTHADDDHVIGLVDLFKERRSRQLQGEPPLIEVGGIWLNSFALDAIVAPAMAHIVVPGTGAQRQAQAATDATDATGDAALPIPLQGVAEGMDLRALLAQLAVPINSEFGSGLVAVDTAPPALTRSGLKLTLIGPTKSNLDRLGRAWRAWLQKQQRPAAEGVPLPSAVPDLSKPVAPDQSVPNLSSIMFVAEYDGRTILFTGDGRAGDVLRGLVKAGLMTKDGTYHVDVLKVPHHGSARNASRKLFRQVTADTYVFSADGTNSNPDFVTLAWLVEALKEQGRKAALLFTNRTPALAELRQEFDPATYGYTVKVLAAGHPALRVRLG